MVIFFYIFYTFCNAIHFVIQFITAQFWTEDSLKMDPKIVVSQQKCIDYADK